MPEKKYNEDEFRRWYAAHAKKTGINPDPDNPSHYYDYRAAFRAGAGPNEKGHWPSKYKRPGHPNQFVGGIDTRTGRPAQPLEERLFGPTRPVQGGKLYPYLDEYR